MRSRASAILALALAVAAAFGCPPVARAGAKARVVRLVLAQARRTVAVRAFVHETRERLARVERASRRTESTPQP